MKPRIVSYTAQDLATHLQATLYGNGALAVTGVCSVLAPTVGHLTFVKGRSPTAAWRQLIKLPEVAVLVEPSVIPDPELLRSLRCVVLVVPNPHSSFVDAIDYYYEPETIPAGIHPTASIDPSATIGEGVSVGPFCVIGPHAVLAHGAVLHNSVTIGRDVSIGSLTRLHSGVVIREGCAVGSQCVIHDNSVIGADGFGYIQDPTVGIRKVPQVGIVVIGDHVEIGANTSIDRATVGVTAIGSHTKIDNQVQIGHNVRIGSHCIICAQVGIAGSAIVGDGVVLGGGTGVADHVQIASRVRVGGHAGVTTDILEPGDYLGMPATKAGIYRRQQASLKRLGRLKRGSNEK
jgi:UDP-3-O-[3-hydroxymyristoyl] glucosamine N-acyltransferase